MAITANTTAIMVNDPVILSPALTFVLLLVTIVYLNAE